jgi:hypothetical protein
VLEGGQIKEFELGGHYSTKKKEEKNACKFFGGKPEVERQLRKSSYWQEVYMKWILKRQRGWGRGW